MKHNKRKRQTRKPRILEIFEVGEPVIRAVAKEVKNPKSRDIRDLARNMLATCKKHKGLGISAPQVGRSLCVFIVASKPNKAYPDAPNMKPTVMINPRIKLASEEIVFGWEGCLSIPGIRAAVPRYEWVLVEYTTTSGHKKSRKLFGFLARIFQHEFDHLHGFLFIDRVKSSDIVTDKVYTKRMEELATDKSVCKKKSKKKVKKL